MEDPILSQILGSLNRIEGKVDANHRDVNARLSGHMEREEDELRDITKAIEEDRKRAEELHRAMLDEIKRIGSKADVTDAFLLDRYGKPDLVGHRNDHETRLTREQQEVEDNRKLKQNAKWWGLGGSLLIMFYALVEYAKKHIGGGT